MFRIDRIDDNTVSVEGRLDAANAPRAQEFLDGINGACTIDMGKLEYISSAGLGVLLRTHKRLAGTGQGLRLVKVSNHINDIFMYSGFDRLFKIETSNGD